MRFPLGYQNDIPLNKIINSRHLHDAFLCNIFTEWTNKLAKKNTILSGGNNGYREKSGLSESSAQVPVIFTDAAFCETSI